VNIYKLLKEHGRTAGVHHNRYEDHLLDQIEFRETPWQPRTPTVKVVWCLKCAVRVQWVPTQDGYRHSCGHPLSLYGPFEEPPSLFPTPKPLKPVWWAGNKPIDPS
jgi:hypothetical protein